MFMLILQDDFIGAKIIYASLCSLLHASLEISWVFIENSKAALVVTQVTYY